MQGAIAVLTAKPELEIYREMAEAAAQEGVGMRIVNALGAIARNAPAGVWSDGHSLDASSIIAVLPRVGNWRPDSTLAVLEAFQTVGVATVNRSAAIRCGRDHWQTAQALSAVGIPHPLTIAGAEPEALAAAAAESCGFPCVVKQRRSRQGVGVLLCANRAELEAVLDSLWRLGDEVIVQRFCPPGGISRRVLVLGDEVLGVTEHLAHAGEFRANAARGATVRVIEIDRALADLALSATNAVGLGFAGVDLFLDGDRWIVGEVNPSPGWKHFAAASGVPVALRLVKELLRIGRQS